MGRIVLSGSKAVPKGPKALADARRTASGPLGPRGKAMETHLVGRARSAPVCGTVRLTALPGAMLVQGEHPGGGVQDLHRGFAHRPLGLSCGSMSLHRPTSDGRKSRGQTRSARRGFDGAMGRLLP